MNRVLRSDTIGNATWVDLATLPGNGDDLGSHIANQGLTMSGFSIIGAGQVNGTTANFSANVNAALINGTTIDGDFTNGSIIFSNTSGVLTQNNANFFWGNNSSNGLGLGTNTPNALLDVGGATKTNVDGTDDLIVADDVEINGRLYVEESVSLPIQTQSGNYTLDDTDYTVLGNASGGNIIFTLPNATTRTGRIYKIKKIDTSANTVTVTGSQNIDGSANYVINSAYESIQVQSNGTEWFIL
jgi:hypothetical protein